MQEGSEDTETNVARRGFVIGAKKKKRGGTNPASGLEPEN